jgi:hypothetical protein
MSETSPQPAVASAETQPGAATRSRMSTRQRILFFVTAWLIVLMPFLFWWNTWFGRRLSDKQMEEYLLDEKKPRHIQHALVQLGERMAGKDPGVTRWYPDLVRLASHPIEEVRNTDAWVMGQDTSDPVFHDVLRKMLNDPSLTVRGNAALSLVRYGDASGRSQIVALLQPARVTSQSDGQVLDASSPGTPIHQGGLVAKIKDTSGQIVELRSPIAGRLRSLGASQGQNVAAGSTVAVIDPASEQVWEALRALYLVGQPEDLPAITPWERDLAEIPDRNREQARATEKAIRERAK